MMQHMLITKVWHHKNPLKSQDGGKKTALVQKRVSFVAVNIYRDA